MKTKAVAPSEKGGLMSALRPEFRFFWNGLNPWHGTKTVLVSKRSGEIIGVVERNAKKR